MKKISKCSSSALLYDQETKIFRYSNIKINERKTNVRKGSSV